MPDSSNTLNKVPVVNPTVGTFIHDDGLVTISYPRYKKAWQVRFLLPKGRKNEIKLDFDQNGSAVWKLIDGKRTVRQILYELQETGEGQEQFNDRVVLFLQSLVQNDFVTCE